MRFWAQTKSLHHSHSQRLEARAPQQRAPRYAVNSSRDQATLSSISIKYGKFKSRVETRPAARAAENHLHIVLAPARSHSSRSDSTCHSPSQEPALHAQTEPACCRERGTYLGAYQSVVVLEAKALLWAGSQDLCNRVTFSPVHSCCFSTSATCYTNRKPRSAQAESKRQLKPDVSGQKLDF